MTLQEKIELFCLRYRPRGDKRAWKFIEDFRELMNEYAQLALTNGQVPDAERHICRGPGREEWKQ